VSSKSSVCSDVSGSAAGALLLGRMQIKIMI